MTETVKVKLFWELKSN